MPNWTNNTIIVKGERDVVAKMFNEAVRGLDGELRFSSWFPVPETDRGDEYNLDHFGCMWDCVVRVVRRGLASGVAVLKTKTPWTAPSAFLAGLSARYPGLVITNEAVYEGGVRDLSRYEGGRVLYIADQCDDEE